MHELLANVIVIKLIAIAYVSIAALLRSWLLPLSILAGVGFFTARDGKGVGAIFGVWYFLVLLAVFRGGGKRR